MDVHFLRLKTEAIQSVKRLAFTQGDWNLEGEKTEMLAAHVTEKLRLTLRYLSSLYFTKRGRFFLFYTAIVPPQKHRVFSRLLAASIVNLGRGFFTTHYKPL